MADSFLNSLGILALALNYDIQYVSGYATTPTAYPLDTKIAIIVNYRCYIGGGIFTLLQPVVFPLLNSNITIDLDSSGYTAEFALTPTTCTWTSGTGANHREARYDILCLVAQ